MAKRTGITDAVSNRNRKRTRRASTVRSLLSDPEFVSSCANFASFVGDTLNQTGNPVGAKVLNGVAAAARKNLVPQSKKSIKTDDTQTLLSQLATEWAGKNREDDPEAYDRMELRIEALQELLSMKSGDAHDG